jgi:hypothetical protein
MTIELGEAYFDIPPASSEWVKPTHVKDFANHPYRKLYFEN